MAEWMQYDGSDDTWHAHGHKLQPVYSLKGGKFIGRCYRFDERKRPQVGDPVTCWGGGVHFVAWVRAHRRNWRVRTEDGVLRTVVEFPTSFIWSQVA